MKDSILIYKKILKEINNSVTPEMMHHLSNLLSPHAELIAKHFYRTLLANNHAAGFLNHDLVKARLTKSMSQWIKNNFIYRSSASEISTYIDNLLLIGQVHARIDLPVVHVNYGMNIIKKQVMHYLIESPSEREELAELMLVTNQLLDLSLAVINESFTGDMIINENKSHAFSLHASSQNLAFECERLRTSLSEWMRELLLSMQSEKPNFSIVPTIRHSNFGLWITHKAQLYLKDRAELGVLNQILDDLDENIMELSENLHDKDKMMSIVNTLNILINNSIWLLGNLAKEMIDENSGKDTLTHLLNRRYLDTVLRQETDFSIHKGMVYGLICVDIDHFKRVNDTYGHDAGDRALVQVADILRNNVRTGDFVFRLGGEEFLVILSDVVKTGVVKNIAEKIRLAVESFAFVINDTSTLDLTVSLGTAFHDGHPDYDKTIKLADTALYQAKENGRNQVVSAKQRVKTYGTLAKQH